MNLQTFILEFQLDCIFCKLNTGEIPTTKLYEDDLCYVVRDIQPSAPTHLLMIPKKHISTLSEATESDTNILGHLMIIAKKMAEIEHLAGYKLALNVNKEGGQEVFHIHLHLLGGWK